MADSRKEVPDSILISDVNIAGDLNVRASNQAIITRVVTEGDICVSVGDPSIESNENANNYTLTSSPALPHYSIFSNRINSNQPAGNSQQATAFVLHRPHLTDIIRRVQASFHHNNSPTSYFNTLLQKENGVKELFSYFDWEYTPWVEQTLSDFHSTFENAREPQYLIMIALRKDQIKKLCAENKQETMLPHIKTLIKNTCGGFYFENVNFDGNKFMPDESYREPSPRLR